MKKHIIRIYFGRETQADFLHLAGEIITKMTENASFFPNLPVPLTQIMFFIGILVGKASFAS